MVNVNDTLAERGSRYGDFKAHAEITQGLKGVMQETPGWKRLTASMKEALEMVMHKVGRILNGDPTYSDSWHDIAGYAKLVDDELTGPQPGTVTGSAAPRVEERDPRPIPTEFTDPAAPKTKADFAKAVSPALPAEEDVNEKPAEKAEENVAPVNLAKPEPVAVKLPENVSKYVAPKAPVAPAAPVAPVSPVDKD